MTINQLIKQLEKIRDKHGKRMQVVVNLTAIRNYTPDEYSHGNINGVVVQSIPWCDYDDDPYLKDGTERIKTVCTIGDE